MKTVYITGAGVSSESGIPTFRGEDGYWTIGSKNYTPQQMATCQMFRENTGEFLAWYYHRFITYQNHQPNDVHRWLANKSLITQNIDGLDAKAGNHSYIPIHGRVDKMVRYCLDSDLERLIDAPWHKVKEDQLKVSLFDIFNIDPISRRPELDFSYRPFVLLFDEYYTELYRISDAQNLLLTADKMVFMGTSFSVGFTQMALQIAFQKRIPIEVVDPKPVQLPYDNVRYWPMRASEYIHLV